MKMLMYKTLFIEDSEYSQKVTRDSVKQIQSVDNNLSRTLSRHFLYEIWFHQKKTF